MPRRSIRRTAGLAFHVINRGVRRSTLFKSPADFDAFITILREAGERTPMRVLAIALMGTHWHMVLWPREDGDLTKYVGWASLTHACRWQRVHDTRGTGPVYQGRFKAIPIETDEHLLTVCRYVERNPVRAGLVSRAEDWPWSSASELPGPFALPLHPWPITRPPHWLDIVNTEEPQAALDRLRGCITRSAPFGRDAWCAATVARLAWTSGLRPVGRPARESLPE